MRTLAAATILMAGCLPHADDTACHEMPPNSGKCGNEGVDPSTYVGYLSPSVLAMPDGSVRVAATRVDTAADTRVELATVRPDGSFVRRHVIGLDEPILPQIAGLPGGAVLLAWQERASGSSFVGPLVFSDKDGGDADRDVVDPTAVTALPPSTPIGLYRVGDRVLAAGEPVDGATSGQFLRASDGAAVAPLSLAGDPSDTWLGATDDATGQAGVWAQLVAHPVPSAGFELRVTRVSEAGVVIGDAQVIARTNTPAGAIAVTPDGGAMVAYRAKDGTTHVARLARAGQVADLSVAMQVPTVLAPHGSGFLAAGVDEEGVIREYTLDGRGQPVSGPAFFPAGSVIHFAASASEAGFAMAANTFDDQIVAARLDGSGSVLVGPLCIECR